MLQPGDQIREKYTVVGQAGRGGMSTVYKVRDKETGREMAVKAVEKSNQIYVQSLISEGETLKKLNNPHLPRVYGLLEEDISVMLVMDYIEGESLDKVIENRGPQSLAYICNWGMQLCDVLTYLHQQRPPIIYRDMKPANVILQPDGTLVLIDFGTVRTQKTNRALQSDTINIGTEGFAAPEQYGGLGQSDARTDIFCMGATLYNLATGRAAKNFQDFRPVEEFVPELADSPLNGIIKKCTEISPQDRYQTASDLRLELSMMEAGLYYQGGSPSRRLRARTKAGLTQKLSGILKKPADLPQKPQKESGTRFFHGRQAAPEAPKPADPGPAPAGNGAVPAPGGAPFWAGWSVFMRLMVAACAAALLLMALGVSLTLAGAETAGIVLLIFALAAGGLAVFGAVEYLQEK